MRKAAILGSGPAGLLAAHACSLMGVNAHLFSLGKPSSLYGAQFLGRSVPGLQTSITKIDVAIHGTEEEYRNKVYGPDYSGPVSPSLFVGSRVVYDIRDAYSKLWDAWEKHLTPHNFIPKTFPNEVRNLLEEFDFVFSSLPADKLCLSDHHRFDSREVWAIGDAPDLDVTCPISVPAGSIVYSGNDFSSWYRAANIFGHRTAEWPGAKKPPVRGVVRVRKPIGTNCTCHPEVIRIGRYGEWKKGMLAYHAFEKTLNYLANRGVQGALF